MAPPKKSPSSSKTRSSASQPYIKKVKGENFYHDAKTANRLKMLKGGKAVRDKDGRIIQAAAFQKGEDETKPGRVQPDRRWFGNTRVISQTALDHFRTSLAGKKDDPYSVLLRRNKLPMALLDDAANPNIRKRSHILETEAFKDTFGPKAQRKKPRLDVGTFEELSKASEAAVEERENATQGEDGLAASTSGGDDFQTHADIIEPIYAKGTSRRIYGELYKVIDSSDVIIHVIDARDPMGTLCESVLEFVRKEKAHKQVVLVINKCDLVPNWVTARYIQQLTPRYPTLAFHASPNHSFGKGSLIQLLRQFSQLHSDKKQISVGFIGYPNVGKSSVINTLKAGKVCNVAPVPGETKVWQYITLTKRIYLIDCPGIVPTSAKDSQTSTVLKGVVRVEALATPSEHIPTLMERVKPIYLSRTYGVPLPDPDNPSEGWDPEAFLDKLARMKGRLLKGGEPDREAVAKILLSDWVRGRIPFFVPPPDRTEELNKAEAKKARIAGKDAKGKGKAAAVEEPERQLHVSQHLGSIMQKNSFVGDDVRPLEEDGSEEDTGEEIEESEDDDEEKEKEEEEEENLGWNDVFKGDQVPEDAEQSYQEELSALSGKSSDDEAVASDESEEEPSKAQKEPRLRTNKKKATNFYTNANVKNKNRHKAAILKSLQSGNKSGGRRRR
ncbi:NGP1NT-domain-containing protein [Dichomitus squalens LYAD-421 SS1]|uniref:NGP1NT-domain-containing protein n=1 Tax=Dichomitus squalens (strain LYAD-421) TaxID=732165 RepID=UPI000441429E|nr:NGP1NT-domain-containing protein [Dichomitus squalens LYAD-421 SS1]EJF67375.1 NGP1NT-domain-containing protein [Dichomitus squalens LYAD-421 SS1]